jgi:hypothetical protein
MRAMKRASFVALALSLVACAAPQANHPQTAFALGHNLACDASELRPDRGDPVALPISLSVPDGGGAGRFCIATGCEDAQFEPTAAPGGGWTAIMRTNDRTSYNADLEISRDLRSFTLWHADSEGAGVWSGTCSAAGP